MKNLDKAQTRIRDSEKPMDDFKAIHGIGQAVEQRLHQAGILTYQQLAEQSPQELAMWLEDMVGFTEERITEQDWPGKAARLAGPSKTKAPVAATFEEPDLEGMAGSPQHHSFTVELLLDEDHQVRKMRVQHIRTKVDDAWAGWDGKRLEDFLIRSAGVAVSGKSSPAVKKEKAAAQRPKATAAPDEPEARLAGAFNIRTVSLLGSNGHVIEMLVFEGERLNVRLDLDISQVERSGDRELLYEAEVYVRPVGRGERFLFASGDGKLIEAQDARIDLPGGVLAAGQYKLDAVVILRQAGTFEEGSQLMALSEGKFIRATGKN